MGNWVLSLMSAWMVEKVALCSTYNCYSLFINGNLLLTARSADLGNCLLSLMSAWMVGKVAFLSIYNYYSLTYC